jgi:hypothetical protein
MDQSYLEGINVKTDVPITRWLNRCCSADKHMKFKIKNIFTFTGDS